MAGRRLETGRQPRWLYIQYELQARSIQLYSAAYTVCYTYDTTAVAVNMRWPMLRARPWRANDNQIFGKSDRGAKPQAAERAISNRVDGHELGHLLACRHIKQIDGAIATWCHLPGLKIRTARANNSTLAICGDGTTKVSLVGRVGRTQLLLVLHLSIACGIYSDNKDVNRAGCGGLGPVRAVGADEDGIILHHGDGATKAHRHHRIRCDEGTVYPVGANVNQIGCTSLSDARMKAIAARADRGPVAKDC